MDQRQFIKFLFLSMAVLMLSQLLFPGPKPKPRPAAPAPAAGEAPAEGDEHAVVQEQPAAAPDEAAVKPDVADQPAVEVKEVPPKYVTLGSLDVDTGYRMLVTLINRGAAVQRVELSSPRFRDLHDRTGYLGELALEYNEGGAKVGVVGAGTPAEKAGVEPGDVIVSAVTAKQKGVEIKTADDFQHALANTRAGQEVTLNVLRDGKPLSHVVSLTRRPLAVMRPEIENIHMRDGKVPDGFVDPPSFLVSLTGVGGKPLEGQAATRSAKWLEEGNWELVNHDQSSVTFERPIPEQGLKIVKRYTLEPVPQASRDNENYPGYDIRLDVEIHNTGNSDAEIAYRLDGPTGLPIEGWWYTHKISQRWFSAAGLRDVAVRFQGSGELQVDCSTIAADKAAPMGQGRSLAYAGVDSVYFSSILIPIKDSLDEDWFETTEAIRVGPKLDERTPKTYTNVTCRLVRNSVKLAAGGPPLRDSYQVFIGPKRPELLAQYQAAKDPNYTLKDIVYYGMTPFGDVAKVMLWILHAFYGIVGNYGIAIIMLTVLVRGAMFPISFRQTKSMARMQALKPELDRLTEKYKTDMQKRSQATQDLYRKHGINPLGGCLPVFLQLPIFIGLYRSIMIDVELRQMPLFGHWMRWCSDLSAPDMLFDWSSFMPDMVNNGLGLFGLGRYFNLLPLITVSLFLVSQKLTMPPPTNEQAAMQQKMMKYMTVFMGLMFYKVASGLCLYFIASSLWGIGERKLLGKTTAGGDPAGAAAASGSAARSAASDGNGRNGSAGKKAKKAKRRQ